MEGEQGGIMSVEQDYRQCKPDIGKIMLSIVVFYCCSVNHQLSHSCHIST